MKFLVSTLIFFTLCCAGPREVIDPQFWEKHNITVAVALEELPKPEVHIKGYMGILDAAFQAAIDAPLNKKLSTYDVNKFRIIQTRLAEELTARGMNVKIIDKFIKFNEYDRDITTYVGFDHLSRFVKDDSVDYLIVLSVNRIGVVKSQSGIVTMKTPLVICEVSGEMFDMRQKQTAWKKIQTGEIDSIKISDKWDAPPDFVEIMDKLDRSVIKSQDFLFFHFFGTATIKR